MSQPVAYTPVHTFVSDSATLANFPGQQIDVELNALKATTDQVRANMALIQRDDGSLKNVAVYTVATLPAAATQQGQRQLVTDATATTFNSTVAGGGANIVPVFSDGANWKIG